MATKFKTGKKKRAWPLGIVLGSAMGFVVSVILCMIVSSLVLSGTLSESVIYPATMVCVTIGGFAASIIAVSIVGHHKLPVALAAGVGFYLLRVLMTGLVFGGAYSGLGMGLGASILGAGVLAVFHLLGWKAGAKKIRKYRFG